MNTCTSDTHPNTVITQAGDGPCPYCAALVELGVLLKIRTLLAMPDSGPAKAESKKTPDPLTVKPETENEAWLILRALKRMELKRVYKDVMGKPVRNRPHISDDNVRLAIINKWFPATESPPADPATATEDSNGTKDETPPGDDVDPVTYLIALRDKAVYPWAKLAAMVHEITGETPAGHTQEAELRNIIMADKFGEEWQKGEE